MEKFSVNKKSIVSSFNTIHGRLNVQIIAARNLKDVAQAGYTEILKDAVYKHSIRTGYSNPFCRVSFNGCAQETSVIKKCTEPQWSYQQFYFDVKLVEAGTPRLMDTSFASSASSDKENLMLAFSCTELQLEICHQEESEQEKVSSDDVVKCKKQAAESGVLAKGASYVVSVGSVVLGSVAGKAVQDKLLGKEGPALIGKVCIDLLPLLTGQTHHVHGWFPLRDESGEECGDVKISVDFALGTILEPGDYVTLLTIEDSDQYFPLKVGQVMEVEDTDKAFDKVLVTYYSPENWKCVAELHPNLLQIVTKREKTRLERYEEFLLHTTEAIVESGVIQSSVAKADRVCRGVLGYASSYIWGGQGSQAPPQEQSSSTKTLTSDSPSAGLNSSTAAETEFSSSLSEGEVPYQLECPITAMPITNPVVAADGHTYEREAIERWLSDHDTSPMTGQVLPTKNLFKNYSLLNSIERMKYQSKQQASNVKADEREDDGGYEEKKLCTVVEDEGQIEPNSVGSNSHTHQQRDSANKKVEVNNVISNS